MTRSRAKRTALLIICKALSPPRVNLLLLLLYVSTLPSLFLLVSKILFLYSTSQDKDTKSDKKEDIHKFNKDNFAPPWQQAYV